MQGLILDFSVQEGKGIITTTEGKRYSFTAQEWKQQEPPVKGQAVDFEVDFNNNAIGVYAAVGASGTAQQFTSTLKAKLDPGDKPRASYNPLDWYVLGIKNYTNFNGRSQRKEFWFYVLMYIVGLIVTTIVDSVLFGTDGTGLFSSVFMLVNLLPYVAVAIRRLHDIGKSGWWLFLNFIPLIGTIILIIWFAQAGDTQTNAYGDNPALLA